MGCEGCLTSAKGMNEQLNTVQSEAKVYAINNNTAVAIYLEGYEYKYCIADFAITNNYQIVTILSQYK